MILLLQELQKNEHLKRLDDVLTQLERGWGSFPEEQMPVHEAISDIPQTQSRH